MTELGGVSRRSVYRFDPDAEEDSELHMELPDAIQRIALEMPSYGQPPITLNCTGAAGA